MAMIELSHEVVVYSKLQNYIDSHNRKIPDSMSSRETRLQNTLVGARSSLSSEKVVIFLIISN